MRKSVAMIPGLLLSINLFAQTFTAGRPEDAGMSSERLARIDNMVNEYVAKKAIPGAVVFIARNGKVVYHKAYGVSDIEKQTPLKKDDIFRIASQTKAITSTAVLMLYEEGKLLLDDPLSKYIPEFKNPKVLVTFNEKDSSYTSEPAKSEITIRQLLTHSSGIGYASIGSRELKAIYAKAQVPSGIGISNTSVVLADKIKALAKLPLKNHPGEKWLYGLNTDVLGYLIEVLSGMTFDEFLRQRIFKPLGMNDTYFYLPKEKQSRLVKLYEVKNNSLTKPKEVYDRVNPDYPNSDGKYFSGG